MNATQVTESRPAQRLPVERKIAFGLSSAVSVLIFVWALIQQANISSCYAKYPRVDGSYDRCDALGLGEAISTLALNVAVLALVLCGGYLLRGIAGVIIGTIGTIVQLVLLIGFLLGSTLLVALSVLFGLVVMTFAIAGTPQRSKADSG